MRMKIIKIIALTLATLNICSILEAFPMSERFPGLPKGTYMNSIKFTGAFGAEFIEDNCRSCTYVDNFLNCECFVRIPYPRRWSRLNINQCDEKKDISNWLGTLVCWTDTGEVIGGS